MKNIYISYNCLTKWFWFCAGVIILFKLLLIGKNEIVTIPYDSLEYVRQAANEIYSIGPTPKGYPLWLWVTKFFGVPQRLLIEFLYLSCSLMLAYIIGRIANSRTGLLVLFLLSFSPNSFFLFDRALSDGFYMCLTLVGVALSLSIIYMQRRGLEYWIKTLALGLTLGLMLITRNEEPLIVTWILWLVLILWYFVWRKENTTLVGQVKSVLSFIALIAIAAYSLLGSVLLMHYLTNGVATGSLATLPSHVELLKNIARIETEENSIRFVPITRKAREMAYAQSPTLRKLQLIIESPKNPYQVVSRQNQIPEGEIGAGWIWHVFNNAAFSRVGSSGVKGIDSYYRTINQEFENAFSNGSLHKKFVIHPLLGSNLFAGMRYFPSSFLNVIKHSLNANLFQPDLNIEPNLFDLVCLRRTTLSTVLTHQPVQGWSILETSGNTTIKSVQIETEYNQGSVKETSRTNAEEMLRNDVVDGYTKAEAKIPKVYGFRAQLNGVLGVPKKIIYTLSDSRQIEVAAPFRKGVSIIDTNENNIRITQGLDLIGNSESIRSGGMGFQIQNRIISISEWMEVKMIAGIVILLGLFYSLIQLVRDRSASISRNALLIIFISGIVMFRILFYSLLDAAAWSVELRYLAPINCLLLVILSICLAEVSQWVMITTRRLFPRSF